MTNGFGPKTPFLIGVAGGTASGKVRNEGDRVRKMREMREGRMEGRDEGRRGFCLFPFPLSCCVAFDFYLFPRGQFIVSEGNRRKWKREWRKRD